MRPSVLKIPRMIIGPQSKRMSWFIIFMNVYVCVCVCVHARVYKSHSGNDQEMVNVVNEYRNRNELN